MINIAIVEDENTSREKLRRYLNQYQEENRCHFDISFYHNGQKIIDDYPVGVDIIFMDIVMPLLDGMETAKHIRKTDEVVEIVFITSMMQYAVEGYQVRAIDYILKPLLYSEFKLKLDKVVNRIKLKQSKAMVLSYKNDYHKVYVENIKYVEIVNQKLCFHLLEKTIEIRGTMKAIEKELEPYGFFRCDSCFLVNLNYVTDIQQDEVYLGDECLHISRARKKKFINKFTEFLSKV